MNERTAVGITFALLGFYVICMVVSKVLFICSEPRYKWVKRHCKFLKAISEDFRKVSKSVEEIKKKARQIGGWEQNNLERISQSLVKFQPEVKKVDDVLHSATMVVHGFEGLLKTQKQLIWFAADLVNFYPTIDNISEMKRTTKEIKAHMLEHGHSLRKMSEVLEQTRERVRSLRERPIGRTKNEFMKDPANPAIWSEALVMLWEDVRPAMIKVNLLQALVKDLRFVKLESEIEKAWLLEACDIIEKVEHSISAVSKEDGRMVKLQALLGLRNWFTRWEIGRRIAYFNRQYSDLIKAKTRYFIKFLRRDSKKILRRRVQRAGGGIDVPTVLAGIRTEMQSKISIGSPLRQSVLESLERLELDLKEERAEEGAFNAREACFELLKDTAVEVESRMKERGRTLGARDIDRINEAVVYLEDMVEVCSVKAMSDSCFTVGFDEDVHRLVSILLDLSKDGSRNEPTVISIVGTQGIGKTTLAKEIMNHSSIMTHFKVRLVIFSSTDVHCDEARLLETVGRNILKMPKRTGNKDFWINEIHNFLKSQACLVVLDDLPSKKAWDTLKQAFPIKSKSVAVVTTRSKGVSKHVNPRDDFKRTHWMRLRTEVESWEYFNQMVNFPTNAGENTNLLAKRVVARTGGLPMAITHIAYLLFGKDINEEELTKVLDGDHIARDQWSITYNISKDYFQSRPDLAKCFSYSEFFPADFKIPARRLLALWVVSSLVPSSEEAVKRLQELVDCNVIQVVDRKRNGAIQACRFPSAVRDMWVKDNRNKAARARSWSLFASHSRHLAYCFDNQDTGTTRSVHGLNSDIVLQEEKYPRSIMFFDTSDGNKPNEDIGNFLLKGIASSHKHLQELLVLDLEGVYRPLLPHSIGKLKNLTYLGLRWTFIETLPDSVGKLFQLQTLDLKHTYVKTLPYDIWNLKSLRHLYLSENCRIKHMPTLSSMKNLETLSGVFLDREGSALSSGLDKLPNLESLSNLKNLTDLYVFGKLNDSSLFVLSDLPHSLIELTLSGSELENDPLPMLAKLSCLKFLSFLSRACVGTRMDFERNTFLEVLVLKIWSLPYLKSLIVSPGSMTKLREFEIRNCDKLTTTQGLTSLKTLEELKLTNMGHQGQVIKNEFATARDNSSEKVIHCPKFTDGNCQP